MKPIFIAALLALTSLPTATRAGEPPDARPDPQGNKAVALDEHLPAADGNNHARSEESAFVLTEVRKVIESNPANNVVELSIDPDYSCDKDTYLVNAVVAAKEQRFSLGVILTLQPVANGWKTLVAFVD